MDDPDRAPGVVPLTVEEAKAIAFCWGWAAGVAGPHQHVPAHARKIQIRQARAVVHRLEWALGEREGESIEVELPEVQVGLFGAPYPDTELACEEESSAADMKALLISVDLQLSPKRSDPDWVHRATSAAQGYARRARNLRKHAKLLRRRAEEQREEQALTNERLRLEREQLEPETERMPRLQKQLLVQLLRRQLGDETWEMLKEQSWQLAKRAVKAGRADWATGVIVTRNADTGLEGDEQANAPYRSDEHSAAVLR